MRQGDTNEETQMRFYAVAATVLFYAGLFLIIGLPLSSQGDGVLQAVLQRGGPINQVALVVLCLAPLCILSIFFKQDSSLEESKSERETIKRDLGRTMSILSDLGKKQAELTADSYQVGKSNPSAEVQKLATTMGPIEASLDRIEGVLKAGGHIDKLLSEFKERQANAASRLAQVQVRLAPIEAGLNQFTSVHAKIVEGMAAIEKAGGPARFAESLAGIEAYIATVEPTVTQLETVNRGAMVLLPQLVSTKDRIGQIRKENVGIVGMLSALEKARSSLAEAVVQMPDKASCEEKLARTIAFLKGSEQRVSELEALLPSLPPVQAKLVELLTRIEPLEDEGTGLLASTGRAEERVNGLEESLAKLEVDDENEPIRDRIATLDQLRAQLENRVAAVEANARRLVGLEGGFAQVDKKVNGSGNHAS